MSAHIGYAAMLERFPPAEAVALAALAESHGFRGVMATDHFQPWVPAQGESSFVWSVLAAIGERTTGDLGPGVTTPTFRMHPAVVAQASATLGALYPGRHWLGIGSGEALNEHVVGQYWPEAPERINRMFEAVDVIRRLFAGSIAGRDVRHCRTRTSSSSRPGSGRCPTVAPEILVAASGPVTARRAGRSVDGFITTGGPDRPARAAAAAVRRGRPRGGPQRGDHAEGAAAAPLVGADRRAGDARTRSSSGRTAGMRFPRSDIRSPYEFDQLARTVRPEDFAGRMVVSSDPDVHRADIQRLLDLGFDRIYLHNVGRNQAEFLEVFGRDVLPGLRA